MRYYWFNLPSVQTIQKERRYATTLVFILPTNMRKANLFADT